MTFYRQALCLVIGMALMPIKLMEPLANAQDYEESNVESDGDEPTFNIGESCAGLAYMSGYQLRALINSNYANDFHSFCYPEEPSECSDYTPFIKGLGRLTTGDDGYHCELQLQL